ncbi:MAG: pilus assembly protein PilM [Lachnospiraceae bacterium]|nr:pilus assembly protein PilM [Lachnospiraceae bacterium]
MPKILGIEIGASKIRICEEDYKTKNPKVYRSISIKTPQGTVNDGILDVNEELVNTIKTALTENKIKTKQIIFSMSSTKIANREIVIPFVKENKVKELIQANVSDYFPVDLQQYEVGHSIISTLENENGTKQYKVLVFAVPKAMVASYLQLAQALGCNVVALDYSGNSIYQIIRKHCDTGVQMVVKVDESSTMVTILQDQAIVLQRTVAYGVEDAIFAMMEMPDFSKPDYEEAVRTFKNSDCMNDELAQSLSYLVSGISRVVDYFSRNNGAVIEKSYLTGLGGDFKGLAELISNAIEIPLEPLREIKGLQLEKFFKEESFGEFLTCIGASMAPIGFMSEKEKEKKSFELLPDEKDRFKVAILFSVAAFIIAIVLGVTSYLSLKSARDENTRLNNRITELAEAETIYKEYLQQKYTYDKLTFFRSNTVTLNNDLVAFIEEMQQKMPASLNVKSFNADLNGVSLSVTVADKKEAAKLVQEFRTFESVAGVEIAGMTDSGAVMDGEVIEEEPKVSFVIQVIYKGGLNEPTPLPAILDPSVDSDDAAAGADEETLE